MTTCRDATLEALGTLAKSWNHGNAFKNCTGGGCFWMAGNAFHTAVDCLRGLNLKDTYNFGKEAVAFFESAVPDSTTDPAKKDPTKWGTTYGFWVDDYGWWGIAFVTAYLLPPAIAYDNDLKKKLLQYAIDCWTVLHANWDNSPLTWTVGQEQFKIVGGISNTSDSSQSLGGRNCVTNECFWRLSLLLCVAEKNTNYLDAKTNESYFFAQAKRQNILYDSKNLVWQRFVGLPPVHEGDPNWTWLGDQGLFAACCYFNAGDNEGLVRSTGTDLISKVLKSSLTDGVLHEELAPVTQYQLDYACGKGTFMRNIAHINDDYRQYDDFILTNAKAIWKNRVPGGYFPYYWAKEGPNKAEPDRWGYGTDTSRTVLHAAGLSALAGTLPWQADKAID